MENRADIGWPLQALRQPFSTIASRHPRGDFLDLPIASTDLRQEQIAGVDPQFPSELVREKHEPRHLAALRQDPDGLQLRRLAIPELALRGGVHPEAGSYHQARAEVPDTLAMLTDTLRDDGK